MIVGENLTKFSFYILFGFIKLFSAPNLITYDYSTIDLTSGLPDGPP